MDHFEGAASNPATSPDDNDPTAVLRQPVSRGWGEPDKPGCCSHVVAKVGHPRRSHAQVVSFRDAK